MERRICARYALAPVCARYDDLNMDLSHGTPGGADGIVGVAGVLVRGAEEEKARRPFGSGYRDNRPHNKRYIRIQEEH